MMMPSRTRLMMLGVLPWTLFFLSGVLAPRAIESVPMGSRFLIPGLASASIYALALARGRVAPLARVVWPATAGAALSVATFFGLYIALVLVFTIA